MNKLLLFLMIFIISISSVSALRVLSSSQIDFQSNNALYNGPAFVVTGIENGGVDVVTWSINNFDDNVDEGYGVTKTGTIESDFKPDGWTYPIQYNSEEWSYKIIGLKTITWDSSARDWCFNELGGDMWVSRTTIFSRACLKAYETGYFFKLKTGEYNYDVDYTLNVDGQGSDTFTLTETSRDGQRLIGSRNWFQAVIETLGTTFRSDPDIDDKMELYWNTQTSQWKVIDPSPNTYAVSEGVAENYIMNCNKNKPMGYDYSQVCVDRWNDHKGELLGGLYNYIPNIDTSSATVSSSGLGAGSVKFADDNIYRNPLVTLTINADKVGIIRNYGEADIVSVSYPEKMVVGQNYPITIVTKNVGEAEMSVSLKFSCSAYSISGISQNFVLQEGGTKTDSGTIIFTGNVIGCSTGNKCVLSAGNVGGSIDDTYDFTPKVCQMSECFVEGATECLDLTIRKCVNVNGVLKYETVKTCTDKCVQSGNFASCDDGNDDRYCGDGLCDFDLGENSANCISDCDIPPPHCGDELCDARERVGMEFECPADCPVPPPQPISWVVIVALVIAVFAIGGAFYLKAKKEGYF